jgi:signal transduction histidine kinase/ActR/RegA family two-component response regulator
MDDSRVDILLIDDNVDNLTALEAVLSEPGVNLVRVTSGKEALKRLLKQDFALILLDVNMPIMDGFETASLIRARPRSEHTPIIFITAHSDETHAVRGYSLGAVDYILTPVVPEVLRAKVGVFVELFRKTAEIRRQSEFLRQRARQLHELTEASIAINAVAGFDALVSTVASRARDVLDVAEVRVEVAFNQRRTYTAVAKGAGAIDGATQSRESPLKTGDGHRIGAIHVVKNGDFTAEDEAILVQLAQIASVAIQNILFGEEREANHLKDEFLATVSHELRTPLSAMLMWARMLRDDRLDKERAAHGAEVIERSARAQARLVDDLLDMSRIMSGKMHLNMQTLDLNGIVASTLESTRPAAESKSLDVDCVLHPEPLLVRGDPDRLRQVLWNLLSNATKFTPPGGRVELRTAHVGNEVVVTVRDSGEGINPQFLTHVFDRFRQAESSSTRAHGGLGLGLAIVRNLLELHGGEVRAHSDGEGQGATFTVTLPASAVHEAAGATADGACPGVATDAPSDGTGAVRGLRVLMVEDEPDTREAIAYMLTQAGAEVRPVESAEAALAVIAEWHPDVLVSDIGLPFEDGYALIRRVRALGDAEAALPAVALTAYAQEQDRRRAFAAGYQAFLAKPVEAEELLAALVRFSPSAANRPYAT